MYIHGNDLRTLGHGMFLQQMTGRVEENRVYTEYGAGCLDATGRKAIVKLSASSNVNVWGNVGSVGGAGLAFTEEWYSEGESHGITSNPPAEPEMQGQTIPTRGRLGPPGGTVTARANGAVPGVPYRLVLARDNCKTVASVLDARPRVAGPDGVIGTITGTVSSTLAPGTYELCLRNLSEGRLVRATEPVSYTVTLPAP
jgi:hypothetical protein